MKARYLSILLAFAAVFSCSKMEADRSSSPTPADPGTSTYSSQLTDAVITLRQDSSGEYYFYVTDSYSVYPVNTEKIDFPVGTRATTRFSMESVRDGKVYVRIVELDEIETKDLLPEDDPSFGGDPLDIVDDWRTTVEDGFLTIRYRTFWGEESRWHDLRLYRTSEAYTLMLRQDDGGDPDDYRGDALVAFRLDTLPDTAGETVDLAVGYLSLDGTLKTKIFKYRTRTP